jgi:hypothetical protein
VRNNGDDWIRARKRAELWCEAGQPRGRFSSFTRPNDVLEREVPQAVWEAIWRVLDVTDGCVSSNGAPVKVTRKGATRTCADPRFDIHDLFAIAHRAAREGRPPPAAPSEAGTVLTGGICEIDPSSCPKIADAPVGDRNPPATTTPQRPAPPCPPLRGSLWPPEPSRSDTSPPTDDLPASQLNAEQENEEGPAIPHDSGLEPAQADVVRALGRVLPDARKCGRADDPIARAAVAFRPDGSVERVEVHGVDPGSRESCIRRALGKARVKPFPGQTFTVSVTVRN